MKVFSNDYNANLPTNLWPTKGGPAKFAKLFSKILVSRKHEWIGLVDNYANESIKSDLIIENKNKKWWIISLPKEYVHNNFTLVKKYTAPRLAGELLVNEVKKILIKERPDVVFLNGSSCFAWSLLKAASLLQIPTVALHAGIWGLEIDLYADFFSPAGIKILKEMEKDFATLPTCNVFLNETSKSYFIKNVHNIPKKKIRIIPLPCESWEINKNKNTKLKKDINVGLVARWDRIKNHKAFLEVAKELFKINSRYKFFAVTSIPETESYKEFKDSYRENVTVLKPMDQKELRKFYKRMDLMLLPSIFDVSPHVVLEAALEGVPTYISKNVGYAKLFLDNNLKDFIVDFSQAKRAAIKIEAKKLKMFPIKFIKMLKDLHDPKTVINQFELLFKEIIK